jgi:hypothetical protein
MTGFEPVFEPSIFQLLVKDEISILTELLTDK